jgi:hypothetical protein
MVSDYSAAHGEIDLLVLHHMGSRQIGEIGADWLQVVDWYRIEFREKPDRICKELLREKLGLKHIGTTTVRGDRRDRLV